MDATVDRHRRAGVLLGAALLGLAALLAGCGRQAAPTPSLTAANAEVQAKAHAALVAAQDWSDPASTADAQRGLIARPSGQVRAADGRVIWDFDSFGFVQGAAPLTVHPGLWRHARLNNQAGLFKVTEGIWQLRGFDLANLTLVQGTTGWIVIDTLTSRETAAFALAFARQHLGNRPVSAVIFTHSHVDHFGGALGVLSGEDAARLKVPIVAPVGFLEEATSENLLAGNAMARRSTFQFGKDLPRSPEGLVDNGLGKAVAYGSVGILRPTLVVERPREEHVIDGVRFIFHNVPGSEAPSEFTFSLPDFKAWCGSELVSQTLHNVMTPRGAKERDALRWVRYMDEAIGQAAGAEVYFGVHHWPVWGADRIREFIAAQRDVMKYIHDQTVRMANAGLNGDEVADRLTLPPELDRILHTRGTYGAVRHNARGIWQFYLSSFDGNPAQLDPLPTSELGRRLVALAGGAERAYAAAEAAVSQGDLRWAAQLLDGLLRAEPGHAKARALLARTYTQLGQASESSTWRNYYLTGAAELMAGPPAKGVDRSFFSDMVRQTPVDRLLDVMAASINGPKAADLRLKINMVFSDTGEVFVLTLARGVMHPRRAERPAADANATLNLTRPFFVRLIIGQAGAADLLLSDEVRMEGSKIDLGRFFSLLDKPAATFPIVPSR